jgi:hypothetical protein
VARCACSVIFLTCDFQTMFLNTLEEERAVFVPSEYVTLTGVFTS